MSAGRSRITIEQRRLMLEFVKRHPAIATGRFDGPDAARVRIKLLNEMATILNSQDHGATKSPDKWLRSWQDWKSDVKKKAAEIAQNVRGASGGPPRGTALTGLEEEVVELIRTTGITGNTNVPDPLEGSSQPYIHMVEVDVVKEEPITEEVGYDDQSPSTTPPPRRPPTPLEQEPLKKRKKNSDLIDERMVDAMEKQAAGITKIATQLGRLADSCSQILAIWVQSQSKTESKETAELLEPYIG